MTAQQIADEADAVERRAENERLVQEAIDAHNELQRAKKQYEQACARLIPIRDQLLSVAA